MAKTNKTNNLTPACQPCRVRRLFVIQLLFSIIYAFVCFRAYAGPQIPGPLKYLTIWDIHFQFLVSILNLLVILTDSNKLTSLRNAVHHGLSVPFGLSVAFLFWSLFIIDRKLVFPKELDNLIPTYVNHILHSFVAISPLINEYIFYNQRKSCHIYVYLTVFVSYLFQLIFVGYYLDFWIYPIFDVLSHVGRFVFILFCVIFGLLVYSTHGALHSFLWSKEIKDSKKKRN